MSERESSEDDVFEIPAKEPRPEALLRWRRATLVLNAARRFRYTARVVANVGEGGEELSIEVRETKPAVSSAAQKFRIGGHAALAVHRFKEAGERAKRYRRELSKGEEETLATNAASKGFSISATGLVDLHDSGDVEKLAEVGGIEGLARSLLTNLETGISGTTEDLEGRHLAYGRNTYPEKPTKGFWSFVWDACKDTTLIILMLCAVVSLISGELTEDKAKGWYDGAGIAVAVIVVIVVTAVSDYRQSLQFRNLDAEKSNISLQVVRKGRRQTCSIFDLVVGDVVPLAIGDQVPADGFLIEGHSLTIDESSMTGESHPRHKDRRHPFLMSGCKVADGFGTMLLTGVGTNTEWGRVMATLSEDTASETPLQVRLNGVATWIGKAGLAVASLVLIILIARYFGTNKFKGRKASQILKDLVDIFSIAVTIVVVAVPEGLPLAVTLTLAYSMRKMMADKALVRKLAACETMGCSTAICSDKTGTLTLNKMLVVRTWLAGRSRDPAVPSEISDVAPGTMEIILEGLAQNSSGSVYHPPEGGEAEVSASPTEKALLVWGLAVGMDFERCRKATSILHVEAFNSTKKKAGVATKLPGGEVRVHWKGAAEVILAKCISFCEADGSDSLITDSKREELLAEINDMANASLRCIALAYRVLDPKELPPVDEGEEEEELEEWAVPDDRLIFLGVLAMKDPCRPNVPEAVALCQRAGVKVRMVTGDNANTARAIANECGILTPGGIVMEGKDFRVLSPQAAMAVVPTIDVMARSSPTDKLMLVKLLRQMGEVVGVTGDGTNDAPALHEADIGLAMGIAGTEVAKESSDIIILDDNFGSIVKVVRWGRSVFANIQKFIQFQLTVNVAALVLNFVAACADGEVPLTAVQLLWVNLIMDTLGALALATEAPTDDLLLQKPIGRRSPLITNVMWRNIIGQAAFQLAVLMTFNFAGKDILNLGPGNTQEEKDHADRVNRTFIFNAFVFCQIFNEINSRKPDKINVLDGLFSNALFCGIIVISVVFQVVIVEFLKDFASTEKLSVKLWIISICIGFVSMPLAVLIKLIPVPETPFLEYLPKRKKKRKSEPLVVGQPAPEGASKDASSEV